MAHNPEWHAEYLRLENAHDAAREEYHAASRIAERTLTPSDLAKYEAALEAMRVAGEARWDFEMAGVQIVDIATLPTDEWARSLSSVKA